MTKGHPQVQASHRVFGVGSRLSPRFSFSPAGRAPRLFTLE